MNLEKRVLCLRLFVCMLFLHNQKGDERKSGSKERFYDKEDHRVSRKAVDKNGSISGVRR